MAHSNPWYRRIPNASIRLSYLISRESLMQRVPWLAFFLLMVGGLLSGARVAFSATFDADGRLNDVQRRLYVATPGDGPDLSKGGHGVLVFDVDREHEFVKRIPILGLDPQGTPYEVTGIAVSILHQRLFLTNRHSMIAIDLKTDATLWEKPFDGGCGRISVSPDGETMMVPSLRDDRWYVLRTENGETIRKWDGPARSGHALFSRDGRWVFCAGSNSRHLSVLRTDLYELDREVGPFDDDIRSLIANRQGTVGYISVRGKRGFESGDLASGKILEHVTIEGANARPSEEFSDLGNWMVLTPDEAHLWLCDTEHRFLHVFNMTTNPVQQIRSIPLHDGPNWLMFNHDGKLAYVSTGEVIAVSNGQVVHRLLDENQHAVQSQQMVEIHFRDGKPIANTSRNRISN